MYKIEGPTLPGSMEVSEAHTVHLCQFIHCFHKLAELGRTCLLFGVALTSFECLAQLAGQTDLDVGFSST